MTRTILYQMHLGDQTTTNGNRRMNLFATFCLLVKRANGLYSIIINNCVQALTIPLKFIYNLSLKSGHQSH